MAVAKMKKCPKCEKTLVEKENFYQRKDGSFFDLCKKCSTMHVDNFDPETFTWILKDLDFPYVEEEWARTRTSAFERNPNKMTGSSVLGRYLSKMRLGQWKKYSWKDTEFFQELAEESKAIEGQDQESERDKAVRESYENGEINEEQYKTLTSVEMQAEIKRQEAARAAGSGLPQGEVRFDETKFLSEEEMVDPSKELTYEDKLMLATKWGRLYQANEWLELEKKYREMQESFGTMDSDTEGTLILICKTFLKMNQAIDAGDMENFQKLSRVYDSLRKSAKFTAVQNKDSAIDYVSSLGELVVMCEREGGFIPAWDVTVPKDIVDLTMKDYQNYVYKLVSQDLGFGQQIETTLKKIQLQKEVEQEERMKKDDDIFEDLELDDDPYFSDVLDSEAIERMHIMKDMAKAAAPAEGEEDETSYGVII